MKKYLLFGILLLSLVMTLPVILAQPYFGNIVYGTMNLQEKVPYGTWPVVTDGAHGILEFNYVATPWKIVQTRLRVNVWDLEPKTEYQLIYYGDINHNDIWPYATCIGNSRMTSTQGYFKGESASFDWINMLDDGVNQKFWVVLAKDVDCVNHKMIAWNPTEYLFEEFTI